MRWSRFVLWLVAAVAGTVVACALPAEAAYAHERWFVEPGVHAGQHSPLGPTAWLLVFGAVLFVLFTFALPRVRLYRSIDAAVDGAHRALPAGIEWRVVAVLSGIMLVINSLSGAFLAPEQVLPGPGLVFLGRVGQMAIGVLLLSQYSFFLAGVLTLTVAVPLATAFFGSAFLVDYGLEYVALALALIFVGLSSTCPDGTAARVRRWLKRKPEDFAHLPVPILRIGLGLTFVILAVHYKLLNPEVTLAFLDEHSFNFLALAGVTGFTNSHFVFAAAVSEISIGLLLASGIATRFVSAAVLGILLTTFFALGPVELVGHLPIIGIVLLLLTCGSGLRFPSLPRVRNAAYVPSGDEAT